MAGPSTSNEQQLLDNLSMSRLQIFVVAIAVGLNALDGFDVLSISFAAPGIAEHWGISRAALGIVLSMELIGMAIGSIFLGGVADKIGRRKTILGSLVVIALGMFMVTTSSTIVELSVWRVLTGLGIGGMLAAINAVTAEFSNKKNRNLCISLMVIGYPIGGVLGGMIASSLLQEFDWRAVFYFGSAVTAVFIPIFYFVVPESPQWLALKQTPGALEKVNTTMKRMGHSALAALPQLSSDDKSKSSSDIFSKTLILTTVLVTAAYLLHVMTFYFTLKWIPKIVVDMGFAASSAGGVLVWANVGGALGGAAFGILATRFGLRQLMIVTLILTSGAIALFGQTDTNLNSLATYAAIAGFFSNAGMVGLYALCAQAFPTHARGFGTGFVIGTGRAGAVLSPIIAGYLFERGLGLPNVAIMMAAGSLLAMVVLLFLRLQGEKK